MTKNKVGGPVPTGWLGCRKFGGVIPETNLIPLKVPLAKHFNGQLKEEEVFTVTDFMEAQVAQGKRVRCIVDLTNTKRYYDVKKEQEAEIAFAKIQVRGHDTAPSVRDVAAFIKIVNDIQREYPNDLVGVHCTHGHNRTGYMIVAYLVQERGKGIMEALQIFKEHRPPGMYNPLFVVELYNYFKQTNTDEFKNLNLRNEFTCPTWTDSNKFYKLMKKAEERKETYLKRAERQKENTAVSSSADEESSKAKGERIVSEENIPALAEKIRNRIKKRQQMWEEYQRQEEEEAKYYEEQQMNYDEGDEEFYDEDNEDFETEPRDSYENKEEKRSEESAENDKEVKEEEEEKKKDNKEREHPQDDQEEDDKSRKREKSKRKRNDDSDSADEHKEDEYRQSNGKNTDRRHDDKYHDDHDYNDDAIYEDYNQHDYQYDRRGYRYDHYDDRYSGNNYHNNSYNNGYHDRYYNNDRYYQDGYHNHHRDYHRNGGDYHYRKNYNHYHDNKKWYNDSYSQNYSKRTRTDYDRQQPPSSSSSSSTHSS